MDTRRRGLTLEMMIILRSKILLKNKKLSTRTSNWRSRFFSYPLSFNKFLKRTEIGRESWDPSITMMTNKPWGRKRLSLRSSNFRSLRWKTKSTPSRDNFRNFITTAISAIKRKNWGIWNRSWGSLMRKKKVWWGSRTSKEETSKT